MQCGQSATVFVFPGHPHPVPGGVLDAVRGLLMSDSAFSDQMRSCESAFAEFVDWSLMDVLRRGFDEHGLARREVWEPVDFAMMVSVATHDRTLGVAPDAVIGQSYGEIAAAYVAGALTLRDAARLITSPANRIRDAEPTDHEEVELTREALLDELDGLRPNHTDTEFISTVTGAALDTEILDVEYWFANLRQPPLTEHAVRWAYERGYHTFVESTLEPVLATDIQDWLSLRRGRQESANPSAHPICPSKPSDFDMARY